MRWCSLRRRAPIGSRWWPSHPRRGRINPNRPGRWYGFSDFSAAREPLNLPKFEVPDEEQAPVVLVREDGSTELLGRFLDFVIDHEASGLRPPDPNWVAGLHRVHSSPSGLDVAPRVWGPLRDFVFVAEWGDLTPPTNPLLPNLRVGSQVVLIGPYHTIPALPFVRNRRPGPASEQGARGQGLERPYDVKFSPGGAMYISDYGVVEIDMDRSPPYRYLADTGIIWRVSRDRERFPDP